MPIFDSFKIFILWLCDKTLHRFLNKLNLIIPLLLDPGFSDDLSILLFERLSSIKSIDILSGCRRDNSNAENNLFPARDSRYILWQNSMLYL